LSQADEFFNLAIIEFNLGNFKKALALFEKVLQVEPKHVSALIKKGNILGKFGKYDDAVRTYDQVLEFESENVLALINKGLALHYLEGYDSAISCYDKILKIKPDNTIALYNKASSLVRQGKIGEGLQVLQKTIGLDYSYKYKARFDIDFEHIRKNNDFRRLVL
jgi:tetratricopeptide (TPR) repeat protein